MERILFFHFNSSKPYYVKFCFYRVFIFRPIIALSNFQFKYL